jgi:hypothetical protein
MNPGPMEGRYRCMRLLFALLLFVAFPALAEQDPFRPEWAAACKVGGTDFSVRFKSGSGDAERDDQVATLVWGQKKAVVLPIEPALFVPARFVSDARNHCEGIGAFDWPNGKLLLLMPRNDRPSDDVIEAVVIDAKTGKFVQDGGVLGPISSGAMLLRRGAGYRILLERSSHVDPADGGEFPAPDWMLLDEQGGRFVHKWETPRKQSH